MHYFLIICFIAACLTIIVSLIFANSKSAKTNKKLIKPKMSAKNKWLNPTDEFGKMEKGRNGNR